MDLLDRLRLEVPITQAALGGGVSGAELAAAVSAAGGLGTIGLVSPGALARELTRARELAPGRSLAVGLLMPFTRRAHIEVCLAARVEAVALFYGYAPRWVRALREAGVLVMHQIGTLAEARRALVDGAEVLIAQGREAGGHLLGVEPAHDLLAHVRALAGEVPVLLAGGVARAEDVRRALDAGAAAVWCGTRFLLTDECRAHPEYKRRVLGAERTVETTLFGLGWPARHRVVPNAAVERWCAKDPRGPALARWIDHLTAPLSRVVPMNVGDAMARRQSLHVPLYSPAPPLAHWEAGLVEVSPLYAGECARAIDRVRPAREVVRELAARD